MDVTGLLLKPEEAGSLRLEVHQQQLEDIGKVDWGYPALQVWLGPAVQSEDSHSRVPGVWKGRDAEEGLSWRQAERKGKRRKEKEGVGIREKGKVVKGIRQAMASCLGGEYFSSIQLSITFTKLSLKGLQEKRHFLKCTVAKSQESGVGHTDSNAFSASTPRSCLG